MRRIFNWSSLIAVLLCVALMLTVGGCKKKTTTQYTLTIAIEGEGAVSPGIGTHKYDAGTVVTLDATPAEGYAFQSWDGPDGASVSSKNTIVMDKNKSITAVFEKLLYPVNITVFPNDNAGEVHIEVLSTASSTYEHGQTIRLTASAKDGYEFRNWSGDIEAVNNNPIDLVVDSEKNITANFVAVDIEILEQPIDTRVNQIVSSAAGFPAVKVTAGGLPVVNATVTVSEKSGQSLEGTLSGQTDSSGEVIFSDLKLPAEGEFTLVFESIGKSVESETFEVVPCGSGTEADPYQIRNYFGLDWMHNDLTAHYKIMNDIDASASATSRPRPNGGYYGWLPLGHTTWNEETFEEVVFYFTGTIDGSDFTISNLYINDVMNSIGFVGNLRGGCIRNLHLDNVNISGAWSVGALVGEINSNDAGDCSIIDHCSSSGTVSGSTRIGGLIGYKYGKADFQLSNCWSSADVTYLSGAGGLIAECSEKGTITNCYATGSITVSPEASQPQNTNNAGGFCGELKKATVSRCYATGNVTSAGYAGGFAAIVSGSTLTDCYARGTVSKIDNSAASGDYLGGFIGQILYANTFERCYATGLVTSTSSEIGGFIAFVNETATPTITSCYYDKDATGFSDDTDTGKGTPLSTADMKLQSSYDGWDFDLLWTIQEGFNDGYPTLQNMPF